MNKKHWVHWVGFATTGCLLVVVALINYRPILNNTLIADDHVFVNTFRVTPISGLDKLFTMQSPLFLRPFTMFVFWVHSRLFGLNPWPAHLISVLLHSGIAILLFWFLSRQGARKLTAFVAAFLFLLTPVAPEAVTWLSGRADVLVLFFMLLAMCLYSVYLTKKSWIAFAGAMAASAAALLSKEQAYILIILLPSMDFIFGDIFLQSDIGAKKGIASKAGLILKDVRLQLSDRGFLFRHGILLLLICGNVALHFAVLGQMGGYDDVPLIARPRINIIRATLRTMMAPLNESDASRGMIRTLGFYSAFLCMVGAALVFARWRKTKTITRRLFVMMTIFFISATLPANSALFSTGIYQNLKESRLLYSATLGLLSLIAISLLEFGWQRRFWKVIALSALLVLVPVYAVGLNLNNRPWQRAAAINYSVPKQTVELVPDPPKDARLYFSHLLLYRDSYIMGYGFEESIKAAYGRDDLVVIRVKKSEPEPGPDTVGYIFDYNQESGLLRLVREP